MTQPTKLSELEQMTAAELIEHVVAAGGEKSPSNDTWAIYVIDGMPLHIPITDEFQSTLRTAKERFALVLLGGREELRALRELREVMLLEEVIRQGRPAPAMPGDDCPRCNGTGCDPDLATAQPDGMCRDCYGHGEVPDPAVRP